MTDRSKAFGDKRPRKAHLVRRLGGGLSSEIVDLRADVNEAFVSAETGEGYPEILWVDVSAGDINSAGGMVTLVGVDLIQGQTFDVLAHGAGNALLTFSSLKPGDSGYSVALVNTGVLAVASFAAGLLTVNIDVGVSDANAIATAVNAAGSLAGGYIRAVAGGTGAGMPAALAATVLAGGTTDDPNGFSAWLSGVEMLPYHEVGTTPTASLSDTLVRLSITDLLAEVIPRGVDDSMALTLIAAGIKSNCLKLTIDGCRNELSALTWIDRSVGTVRLDGGELVVNGVNLLQDQTFDQLVIGAGASALTFAPTKPGNSGMAVELINSAPLAVVGLVGGLLTVNINAGVTTADELATAVNLAGSAAHHYIRVVSGGGGVVLAAAAAPMVGGDGAGFTAYIGGAEAFPYHAAGTAPGATITDTQLTLTVPDMTALGTPISATDPTTLSVTVDGRDVDVVAIKSADLRPTAPPELHHIDVAGGLGGALTAAGGDLDIYGVNLLQGQAFDQHEHVSAGGGGTGVIDFICLSPGVTAMTLALVDGAGPGVTYVGDDVVVTFRGPTNGDVDDCTAVATLVNANVAATDGYLRANVTAGGADVCDPLAQTPLAGGLGSGWQAYVGGVPSLPANEAGGTSVAKITDARMVISGAAVGAINDVVTVHVVSDGIISKVNLSGVLA